jgi:hypothetical protein
LFAADAAEPLLELLSFLRDEGYAFTTVTPATHRRVLDKRGEAAAADLRDVFGWNLPFRKEVLPPPLPRLLERAGAIEERGGLLRSRLRVASLGSHLFLHSAFPTDAEDAVFFGPDTYRFARFLAGELPKLKGASRLVDIGAGSGAGGIAAAGLLPGLKVTLTDVNPLALRLAAVNARHAGVDAQLVLGSGLEPVEGPVDLIVANPPYVMDECDRTYRDGGNMLGAKLSLDWLVEGVRRLQPGGCMLLYTGVAIVQGRDRFHEAVLERLDALRCSLRYEEIDPDVFGEELEEEPYREVERIAAVGAVLHAK